MKATDFANFFEFHIEIIPTEDYIEILEDDNTDDLFCWATGNSTVYAVIDDQAGFDTRYIDKVQDLTECFDSLHKDYIEDLIEEDGFECDETKDATSAYVLQSLTATEAKLNSLLSDLRKEKGNWEK